MVDTDIGHSDGVCQMKIWPHKQCGSNNDGLIDNYGFLLPNYQTSAF